ncbi:MFS transporter [Streptomyces sp.]|uniref:MFS transporter n=1 Tax=Streptomyces sp. TaxID=1931 RepID=UPI0025EA1372|nr:MFS transporter [Streptomyces sp.]
MLTEWASWRWVMYVNVVFAVPALIGALLLLAKPAITKKPKLDIPGILVVSAALFAVVYGFAHVESTSWTDPVALGSMIVGAVLLVVFVWLETRVAHPLLPLRVVLDRTRGGSFMAVFVIGMGMFSIFLFLTYYFAASLGYSPIKTGLVYLPMVAAVVASSTTMPVLVLPRVGPKIVITAGFLVAAVGMAMLTQIELDSTYAAHIMPGMILMGLGIGAVMTTAFQGATSGLHHEDSGVASALINTGQQVGGSISTALLTTVASSAATDYLASHKPSALAAAQAGVEGYTATLAWGSGFFVAGAVIAAFLIPNRALEPSEGEPVMAH